MGFQTSQTNELQCSLNTGRKDVNANLFMPNTFGHLFRATTFGESHGGAVGVVVDGCPPRLPLSVEAIQHDLDRRRPGQSRIPTPRDEPDRAEIVAGVFEGQTLGSPIAILVRNVDAHPAAYADFK